MWELNVWTQTDTSFTLPTPLPGSVVGVSPNPGSCGRVVLCHSGGLPGVRVWEQGQSSSVDSDSLKGDPCRTTFGGQTEVSSRVFTTDTGGPNFCS